MSFWFPKLADAGVRVPKTALFQIEKSHYLLALMDDPARIPASDLAIAKSTLQSVVDQIKCAVSNLGLTYPIFIRTGQGSGKHDWKNTCFVPEEASIESHVLALAEWSECVDFMGLDYSVWAVRELLQTAPAFHAFNDMPITKERRYFVDEGAVVCHHPYWPEFAIDGHVPETSPDDWQHRLAEMNVESSEEVALLTRMSEQVSREIPGRWSVDWLHTNDGWFCTDMALAQTSWHWPDCPLIPASSPQG